MNSHKLLLALSCALMTVMASGCDKSSSSGKKEPAEPDGPLAATVCKLDLTGLDHYNGSDTRVWDNLHAAATLQGVVNRESARLYIEYVTESNRNIDRYWWNVYSAQGEWLSGCNVKNLASVDEAIEEYRDLIKGAVVYDPAVASTSTVASAVAGIEDLVAIRYDTSDGSLYSRIVTSGPKLPVKVWLVGEDGSSMFTGEGTIPGTSLQTTGSKKDDPYYWFIENYIKTGKCDTRWGGFYIDQYWRTCYSRTARNQHCLPNHDFVVSKKGFFFDLSPWEDEPATDDPSQPSGLDCRTMKDLLLAAYNARGQNEMCYIAGFPSWAHKYTQHDGGQHTDVPTEWEYSRIISQYNSFMDADAISYGCLANASFWQHFPLEDSYPQEWVDRSELVEKGYITADGKVNHDNQYYIFYVGDYDSSAWITQRYDIWNDSGRGKVPLMWAISPVLSERAPQAMHYYRKTATTNDYFVAADNGAGYLNPGELQTPRASGLPSGIEAWREHCKKYYDLWGYTVTGFVIDGYSQKMSEENLKAYASFSPNGICPQKASSALSLVDGTPVLSTMRLGTGSLSAGQNVTSAAETIISTCKKEYNSTGVPLHWFRVVLAKPSWFRSVAAQVTRDDPKTVLLTAPEFFELLKVEAENRAQ